MEQRIAKLEEHVEKIMNNHLPHITESIGGLELKLEKISVNVDWLMRFFWIAATASTGSLVAAILGLILK